MNLKNYFKGLMILAVVSLAFSADSATKSSVPQSATTISSTKSESAQNGLKKQQMIKKPSTSWSKIKDLFM